MPKDSPFLFLEKVMGMDDATWARHANPWSGWPRVATLPLFALAAWSRIRIGWWALAPIAAPLIWAWLNPRVFPPPASTENWMSKAVLGERIWLSRGDDPRIAHHRPVVRMLALAASVGAVLLLMGVASPNLPLTATGLAIATLSKLWFADRMVWVRADSGRDEQLRRDEGRRRSQQPFIRSRRWIRWTCRLSAPLSLP